MKTTKIGRKHFSGFGSGFKVGSTKKLTIIYRSGQPKIYHYGPIRRKAGMLLKVNTPKGYEGWDDTKVFDGATNETITISKT